MKKILLTLMIPFVMGLVACSDDEGGKPKLDDRLVNTKWQTRAVAYEIVYGGTAYDVYEFTSTTDVEKYTTRNGNVVDSEGSFKYTLNYPNLTIVEDEETSYEFEFKDSRTIVRKGRNEYSAYATYIKQ